MALMEDAIDPWNFTILRLLSGAICLGIIIILHTHRLKHQTQTATSSSSDFNTDNNNAAVSAILADKGSWLSSVSLVVYALCFSLAYVDLDAGTGALILSAAVQLTMIGWGIYSIRGKACLSPLRATGFNFIRSLVTIPFLLIVAISHWVGISMQGVVLAVISGAITSGLGYCMWYVAMPLLKNTQAAVVQLCTPILAAILGMVFLSEQLTLNFIIASIVILGAVLVFILNKKTV
ncbi:EamA family transporter [Psychrobacter celer]|uniref:EamA family transporter n=1 Tax=Psychrobacter celer TaxID=306572 RepID=UPI003FD12AE3